MSDETYMTEIIRFAEFLQKIVSEEEERGNKNARAILLNYRHVIEDGIWQHENVSSIFERVDNEKLLLLKKAQRILK